MPGGHAAKLLTKFGRFSPHRMTFRECATFAIKFLAARNSRKVSSLQISPGQSPPNFDFRETERPPSYRLLVDYEISELGIISTYAYGTLN